MAEPRTRRNLQLAALATLPAVLGIGLLLATLALLAHGALVDVVPVRVIGMRDDVVAPPVQWRAWWAASWPALAFAGAVVACEVVVGFALALVLPRRGFGAFVALVLLAWPLAAPPDFVALVRAELAPLAFAPLHLDAEWQAWAAAALVDAWRFVPLVALLLCACPRVPARVSHAADLDGLSPGQRVRHVHLPRLRTALAAALALRLVDVLGTGTMPRPWGGDVADRLVAVAWRGGAAIEAWVSLVVAAAIGGVAYWLALRGRARAGTEAGEG